MNFANLSVTEREIVCSLDLGAHQKAQQEKETLASGLGDEFENATEMTSPDLWKAAKYNKIAKKNVKPAGSNTFNTDNAYTGLGWFTSIRLFLLRANRLTDYFIKYSKKLTEVAKRMTWLSLIFNVAGLSYAFELAVDIGVVLHTTFRSPRSPAEAKLSRWTRFKNVLTKDGRPSRMLNAAVWLGVNLTCFVLALAFPPILLALPFLTPAINMAGFVFDVLLDSAKAWWDVRNHTKLLNKINTEINSIKKQHHPYVTEEESKLIHIRNQLENKITSVKKNRYYTVLTTIGICVGMALFFFPPTSLAGGILLGSSIAFGFGSVLGGLGKRIYLKASEKISAWCNKGTTKSKETHDPEKDPLLTPKIGRNTTQIYGAFENNKSDITNTPTTQSININNTTQSHTHTHTHNHNQSGSYQLPASQPTNTSSKKQDENDKKYSMTY